MGAIPYEPDRDEQWDEAQDDDAFALPTRQRRQFLNRRSAALLALITCAAGFYGGIRVEKGQLSSSSSTTGGFTPPALGGSSTRSPSSTSGSRSGTSGSRSSTPSGFPGGAGGFPGALGGGNASIGTISSVDRNTIYISDTSGNTVKVTLSSATKITKSLGVSKRSLHPGDSVVISGLKKKSGVLAAASISDSGASSSSGGAASSGGGAGSSATGSGAAGGGNSAVNSLFGSRNGG